ncbi:MAG: hypothetical protein JW981_11125 [Anaerolineae bacterium]|nr:hypothetical protein [Anaerolineae bacterium]
MGMLNLGGKPDIGSPEQLHDIQVATETFWAEGIMKSQGDPNLYINQKGLDYYRISNCHVYPWPFSGIPPSSPSDMLMVSRAKLQLLIFPKPEARETYRVPPRMGKAVLYTSLAIIHADIPLLSEAKVFNFLGFWGGELVPLFNASLYFTVEGVVKLPAQVEMMYINRHHIQGYFEPQ